LLVSPPLISILFPYTTLFRSGQGLLGLLVPEVMPPPILNFDGITCNCAPPTANGEAGATQYVQVVSGLYQIFDKATGASILGPRSEEHTSELQSRRDLVCRLL